MDACHDVHSQLLIPDAHKGGELITAAYVTGALSLPTQLFPELVEQPEDKSNGVQEDGGIDWPGRKWGTWMGSFFFLSQSDWFTMKFTVSKMKQME